MRMKRIARLVAILSVGGLLLVDFGGNCTPVRGDPPGRPYRVAGHCPTVSAHPWEPGNANGDSTTASDPNTQFGPDRVPGILSVNPQVTSDAVPFLPGPDPVEASGPEVREWIDAVLADLPDQGDPFAAVDACVATEMTEKGTPGASIAIAVNGVITYTKGYGVKHAENGGEVDEETLFRFGSIMKMMTAAAVMQQAEAGRLDLRAPVTEYIPYFELAPPWDPSTVTPHDLLTHSSGIPDRVLELDSTTSLADWGASLGDLWLNVPPGTFWNYSNPNFSLAGLIVQETSGLGYAKYMKTRVWEPAGMPLTTVDPYDVLRHGNYAWGHQGSTRYAPDSYDNPYFAPAGLGFTTPTELVTWALLLSAGGGEVLTPQSAAAMQAPQVPMGYVPWQSYGYGIVVDDFRVVGDPNQRVTVRYHDGSVSGWSSLLFWLPDQGFVVSVLASTSKPLTNSALCALREVAGVEPVSRAGHTTDPATWDHFTGTYSMVHWLGLNWTAQVDRRSEGLYYAETDLGFLSAQGGLSQLFFDTFGIGGELFTFFDDPAYGDTSRWMRNRYIVGERLGEFPSSVTVEAAGCSSVGFTPGFDIPDLAVRAYGPAAPVTLTGVPISQDDPEDPDSAGFRQDIRLDHDVGAFVVLLQGEEEDDLDLYVLFDKDRDGATSYPEDEVWINRFFRTGGSTEALILPGPYPAGDYQIRVHGVRVEGGNSTFSLRWMVVSGDGLRLEGVPSSVTTGEPSELTVCASKTLNRVRTPLVGMLEFDYGSPPRRVNVMVDWVPGARFEIYLPVNVRR